MKYIWQSDNWPELTWDAAKLLPLLTRVSRAQGRLLGKMEGLGFEELKDEAHLNAMTDDVVKSSEIEGEKLPQDEVRSSIARHLEMKHVKNLVPSSRVDGIVELMTDATTNYALPLTRRRLFKWHESLFPTGKSGHAKIAAGKFRDGPMQVVSGALGKEKVHYEAPPADRLTEDMAQLLDWFEEPDANTDPLLVAGLAHFWFVTIHPFDDGNGRIARAIADMALARAEQSSRRYYSMSKQIRAERNDYYTMLERSQKGSCDITAWQEWFLSCLHRAIQSADATVATVLQKARFWQRFAEAPLNERQTKILNRLLDGFEGKVTTTKWAKMTKSSHDTALRDIKDLIERGALVQEEGGGRSTSYALVFDD